MEISSRIFDSHCHLDDRCYDTDLPDVLDRAHAAGVHRIMIVGIDGETSRKAVDIALSHDGCFVSVGYHPHDAKNCTEAGLKDLKRLATQNSVVRAWGEIGLDFNRMFSPREDQETGFVRQLEMADALDLPIVLHERDSRGRMLEILTDRYSSGRNGVVHCFSGSRAEMDAYLDLGLHIGITGILTVQSRGADLRAMAPHIPRDRILVETDAPYLTPVPERNRYKRNEPAFVKTVLFKLAEVLGENPGDLAEVIWKNTCRLYAV